MKVLKYRVLWKYASSLGGPWAEGQVIELKEAVAAAVNIDSPGVLEVYVEPEPEPKKAAPKKRTVKSGKNRMELGEETR